MSYRLNMSEALDQQLRQARVPERPPAYWERFPQRVVAGLDRAKPGPAGARAFPWARIAAAAAACAVIGAGVLFRPRAPGPAPALDYAKLAREVAQEFPGQLKAIVVDEHGMRVELAESATVPASTPLLVEVCRPQGCRRVVTFSGQQIVVNGEPWDVLVSGDGRVIVAGRSTREYRIAARALEPL